MEDKYQTEENLNLLFTGTEEETDAQMADESPDIQTDDTYTQKIIESYRKKLENSSSENNNITISMVPPDMQEQNEKPSDPEVYIKTHKSALKFDIRKFIPCVYYYVPPCPACQSRATGYYMNIARFLNTQWSEHEALRNGEIVKQVVKVPNENVFCTECGFSWPYLLKASIISLARRDAEIEARGIAEKRTVQAKELQKELADEKKNHKVKHFFTSRFL